MVSSNINGQILSNICIYLYSIKCWQLPDSFIYLKLWFSSMSESLSVLNHQISGTARKNQVPIVVQSCEVADQNSTRTEGIYMYFMLLIINLNIYITIIIYNSIIIINSTRIHWPEMCGKRRKLIWWFPDSEVSFHALVAMRSSYFAQINIWNFWATIRIQL